MPESVLLVYSDKTVLRQLMASLTTEGYEVAAATSFKEAQDYLAAFRPDLLVAAVRLGAFNGIGLALRARATQANLAVVITDVAYDAVLAHEAGRLEAPYVVNPLESSAFLSNVKMALAARRGVHPTGGRAGRRALGFNGGSAVTRVPLRRLRLLDGNRAWLPAAPR
jgi:DNA-binding response OmpR family regulator